jgi:hypothetical protein
MDTKLDVTLAREPIKAVSASGLWLSPQKCEKENFKVFEIVHGSFENFQSHIIHTQGPIYKNKDASGEHKKNSYNLGVKYQDSRQLYESINKIISELKELLPKDTIIKSPLRDNGKQFYIKFSSWKDMPDWGPVSLIATNIYLYKVDKQTTVTVKMSHLP